MKPSSAIIVLENGADDVYVFHDVQTAARGMEPIDVQDNIFQVFDEEGNRFRPVVDAGSIILLPIESNQEEDRLLKEQIKKHINGLLSLNDLPKNLSDACKLLVCVYDMLDWRDI